MASVTLSTLRSRVRARCDMPVAGFVEDTATELDNWINRGVEILHQKLADTYGEDYVVSSSSLSLSANSETVALPTDLLKLLHIEYLLNGSYVTLQRFNRRSINAYRNTYNNAPTVPVYRIEGSNLRLVPSGAAATLRVVYVPLLQVTQSGSATILNRLAQGSDSVNFPSGWEAYAELHAAIQCLIKEESDPTALMSELRRMELELETIKQHRDASQPASVVDVDLDSSDIVVW